MNVYYVVDTTPTIQLDGFYQASLGTHPTREKLYQNKILYEGTNAKEANRIYRQHNRGSIYSDTHNVMIYKGEKGTDYIVLHKV